MTRTIIPIIQVPNLAPGVNGTTGLGDVNVSLFWSPAKAGPVIWGVGPIVSFPTATENILGTKKLSVGPTVVVLRSQGHWLYGALVNNLFSLSESLRTRIGSGCWLCSQSGESSWTTQFHRESWDINWRFIRCSPYSPSLRVERWVESPVSTTPAMIVSSSPESSGQLYSS
jgi:hypothetical protein